MKKVFYNIFIFFFLLCCVSACRNSSEETTVGTPAGFHVTAIARSGSIYMEWEKPAGIEFSTINISYKKNTGEAVFQKLEIPCLHSNYILDKELSDGTQYLICFYAEDTNGTEYKENILCTPDCYAAEADRGTAIFYDGKVMISWAYAYAPDYYATNIYFRNERISYAEIFSSETYEDIDGSVADETPLYNKYYYCIISDENMAVPDAAFEIRALNKNFTESSAYTVSAKEVSLPVMELNTKNSEVIESREKKIPATVSVGNTNLPLENACLTVKGRGNSSWENAPKKSYTLKFDSKQSVLGMNPHKSFALVANYFDKTLLRNVTAYAVGRKIYKAMSWNPDTRSVHLFVNNIYQGIYAVTESNKIDKNRISIPDLKECVDAAEFDSYGFLLEANWRKDENFNFETDRNVVFSLKEPDGESISEELKELIIRKVQAVEDDIFSQTPDFSGIDIDSFIDWWIVNEFAKNPDSNFFSSCYMYFDPADKKFHMGPLWDFDLGFGNISSDSQSTGFLTSAVLSGSCEYNYENWIAQLKQIDEFTEKARNRWNEKKDMLQLYFEEDYTADTELMMYNSGVNFIRWPILGKYVWKNPSGYNERKTYESETAYFNGWVNERFEWLDNIFNF